MGLWKFHIFHHILVHSMLINRSGDIEVNPSPKPNSCYNFSKCHWNLIRFYLLKYNFLKVSLLRTYLAINKFNALYLLLNFLDSSI